METGVSLMKKLTAAVLAAALTLGCASTAFANEAIDDALELNQARILNHSVRPPREAIPCGGGRQNDGGVETHSTRQGALPALTSLCGAVGRK